MENLINRRAKNYDRDVLSWLSLQIACSNVPLGRVGIIVMLMSPLRTTLSEWVNKRICLDDGKTDHVDSADMY